MTLKKFMFEMNNYIINFNSVSGDEQVQILFEMFEYLNKNSTFYHSHPKLNNFRNIVSRKINEFKKDLSDDLELKEYFTQISSPLL